MVLLYNQTRIIKEPVEENSSNSHWYDEHWPGTYFSWIIICDLGQSTLSLFPHLWKRLIPPSSVVFMRSSILWNINVIQAYLLLLHFANSGFFFFFFNKLKFCDNLVSSKSVSITFPTVFTHFMSLCHFGNSCSNLNFSLLLYFAVVICKHWF